MLDNCYKVKKIIYKQHCRCFCPIGQRHYTNNFTVTISPEETIPDYCEIDQWIAKNLEGQGSCSNGSKPSCPAGCLSWTRYPTPATAP